MGCCLIGLSLCCRPGEEMVVGHGEEYTSDDTTFV